MTEHFNKKRLYVKHLMNTNKFMCDMPSVHLIKSFSKNLIKMKFEIVSLYDFWDMSKRNNRIICTLS